ncbi:pre-mRNA-splicing factor syf1 [Naganishia adeliensis]|uniref:Pre-mRNA-splicing factor syf1 n=1 Tax=Naganishia adeliensis TaxID=92952 RepID=A0ACC2X5C0_9TREE|nr:pre-mRNA-splicing factor syf1 [Naganishia adeliensis]
MVSASNDSDLVSRLAANFPLTNPIPTPLNHPELIHVSSIITEEDLILNADNLRAWINYITNVKNRISKAEADAERDVSVEGSLLGPLASSGSRRGLQELTMIYERALAIFPTSFKLWKMYLAMRQSYVLGPVTDAASKAKRQHALRGARTKTDVTEMLAAAEQEYQWEGGLDGLIGFEEWKSLFATGERMLGCLSNLPVPWIMHLSALLHPKCPSVFQRTYARRTFDRALRALPPSLHGRIWGLYLRWAEQVGGVVGDRVWRRLLKVDPSLTERHITHLLNSTPARPLPAAKYLLTLARKAQKGEYTPLEGKSAYQLFVDFIELTEAYAEDIGLDSDELDAVRAEAAQAAAEKKEKDAGGEANAEPASVNGKLIRFEGPPVALAEAAAKGLAGVEGSSSDAKQAPEVYDEDVDPASPRKLDVEKIFKSDGLAIYKDQAGRIWSGLATYWIKRGEFDQATATFEQGIASVLTIRDFTQIFDAYAEFSETLISTLMTAISDPDSDEDPESIEEMETELDKRMLDFEALMDRRPFLVNDVLLRRNPNDVVEWEKRIALHGDDDAKVVETYNKAIETINPRKAIGPLYPIYVNFAKFYEEGGSQDPETGEPRNAPDLEAARQIFEKATRVPFKNVDDLAEVWCEFAEMELRQENYDEAIRVMQWATTIPRNTKVNFYDESLSVQSRLFKSLKLWSFYVDLEESIGTVESTKAVYDKIMELKIANAQVIVNYAQFLEENKYYEESFKVYERGIDLFQYPVAFELWNIYLSKFIDRYGGSKLERTRDLFEQALEKCPQKFCKPLFLMYAQLEEEHGLAKRAMNIYDRAATAMYTIYIAKATANYGLPATRPIYQRAIEVLPDRQTAEMCLRFAAMERKLGEIDRARAIYAHASQFCDPRTYPEFWKEWNSFEIDTGSEDTFREMLRIKRSVQAAFNTEASYLVAQAEAARKGLANKEGEEDQDDDDIDASDPMARMERDAAPAKPATGGPSFVRGAAAKPAGDADAAEGDVETSKAEEANPDAINMDDMNDDDDEDDE